MEGETVAGVGDREGSGGGPYQPSLVMSPLRTGFRSVKATSSKMSQLRDGGRGEGGGGESG